MNAVKKVYRKPIKEDTSNDFLYKQSKEKRIKRQERSSKCKSKNKIKSNKYDF